MTGTGTSGTPRRCWSGKVTLKVEPVHGACGIGALGRTSGTALGQKTQTMRIEGYEAAPPLFPELVFAWFFLRKSGLEARERNMTLAATGHRYLLDLAEQAMTIQFPDDEIRNHDRTCNYRDNILGFAVNEDDDLLSENEEGSETTEEDLHELTRAQETDAQALASVATANRTTAGCSRETVSGRQSTRLPPSATRTARSAQQKAGTEVRHLQWSTPGFHSAQKSKGNPARKKEKRQPTQRTANLQWRCIQERACVQGQHWKRERLCCAYQINGVGSTGRSGTHECATSRFYSFSPGLHKEDIERQQSEREVAFKVHTVGR